MTRTLIVRAGLFVLLAASLGSASIAKPFQFVAYGDTGYFLPRDIPRVETLVAAINREKPAFAIHVGDMKGVTPCTDADYQERRRLLGLHDSPIIMTPGDNDWADCGDAAAGSFEPIERLSALRNVFYSQSSDLGRGSLELVRQGPSFPENARWMKEQVVFATVHAIGPDNGLIVDEKRSAEAIERSKAGKLWITEAFRVAREARAPGLVIATQVNAWSPTTPSNAFGWLVSTIRDEARTYGGQVLIIHGDNHRLLIDTPYRTVDQTKGTATLHNVTRLMVPGSPDHRAVKITVDPAQPALFSFGVIMDQSERLGAPE